MLKLKQIIPCLILSLLFGFYFYKENIVQNVQITPQYTLVYKRRLIKQEKVTITIYNATKEQCDETPGILADGTKVDPRNVSSLRFCALSRDLLARWGGSYDFGDTIYLKGIGVHSGYWVVRDIMNAKHTKMVDLLVPRGTAWIREPNIHIYAHEPMEE